MSAEVPSRGGPISAADAALRTSVRELMVHIPCGGVRGWYRAGRRPRRPGSCGRWQSCGCEDDPLRWPGVDVSREIDLCLLCARGTAGGTSRWASLACDSCKAVNNAVTGMLGRRLAPLHRHSIGNGVGVRVNADEAEVIRQQAALVALTRSWQDLYEWFHLEFSRLASSQGWANDTQVPLRVWLERLAESEPASRDAFRRFTGFDTVAAGVVLP